MGCVLPVVVHLRDPLLFVYYIACAMGDVPFSFFEATELHRAIHKAAYDKTRILPNFRLKVTPESGHPSIVSASHRCHGGTRVPR
jgi:hypothetical protein